MQEKNTHAKSSIGETKHNAQDCKRKSGEGFYWCLTNAMGVNEGL